MRGVVQALRTGVFYLLFMGQTIILAIVVGLIALAFGGTELSWRIAQYWRNSNIAFLRVIVGVGTDVAGGENIPPGPCIFAAKHQSDWDIFAILPFTDDKPAFMAKKELMDIPMFGRAAQSINTITIDRKLGAQAIPKMLEDAREALGRGCRIVIYPEGTRKKPLADPDYRQGITRMYEALDVPVVPVALNSGLYWGKLSATIWPGTARARFLPVKTTNDLLLLRSDAYALDDDDRLTLAVGEAPLVELDPAHYQTIAAFDERFPAGAPSLREATHLKVVGDWTFGAGVGVRGTVAGHLHPAATVVKEGHGTRRRCFVHDGNLLLLPAYGAGAGSMNILSHPFHGLFDYEALEVTMLGRNRLYPVSTRRLVAGV